MSERQTPQDEFKFLGGGPSRKSKLRGKAQAQFIIQYSKYAKNLGIDPNPYAKEHYYDYEGAYKAGKGPDPVSKHWPSEFKLEGHPRMVLVNPKTGKKFNTKTGKAVK